MEIQYYGANCVRITTKKANIVIDGLVKGVTKSFVKSADTALFTSSIDEQLGVDAKLIIDKPGEYEVGDTSVLGISARSYKGEADSFSNTIFKIESEEVKVAVMGNVYPKLTDAQLELLGGVDVLIIPVGNNEVTISGSDALGIIKNIEPYVVIPTHYASSKVKYESTQSTLSEALKELAMEPTETLPKVKFKSNNFNEGDSIKLIVLEH